MRSPRFRFTLQLMMVVVAVVCVSCAGFVAIKRRRERLEFLRQYWWARAYREGYHLAFDGGSQAKSDHYLLLYKKYDRATRYPWLPVEPDPPEPE